jgi:patatin-like phospholipase/acyl hydrolase
MYKILSIDGGGIRGIITVTMLKQICEILHGTEWLDGVDLLAGTSTGGLIALALSSGMSLDEVQEIYENDGPEIFSDSVFDDIKDLGNILGADYDIDNMETALKKRFGAQKKLSDLKKKVIIPAFDLDNEGQPPPRTWKPKIFHNFEGDDSDGDCLVYKVGISTSAAPTFFQSYDGYIDGGVFAGNPSMCALAQTQDAKRFEGKPVPLNEIRMVSLGTGTSSQYISGDKLDWGLKDWAKPIITLMMDGTNGIADYQCRQILGGKSYIRLAPVIPEGTVFKLDDVKRIPEMIGFAKSPVVAEKVQEAANWIGLNWLKERA